MAAAVIVAFRDQLGVRASINIDQDRVFPGGIEIGRQDHAAVQVGLPIGGFEAQKAELRRDITVQRILVFLQDLDNLSLVVDNLGLSAHFGRAVDIDEIFAGGVHLYRMRAIGLRQAQDFARIQVHAVEVVLQRAFLGAHIISSVAVRAETHKGSHHPRLVVRGDGFQAFPVRVVQVDMVVSLAFAEPKELVGMAGAENRVGFRFHIDVVMLFKYRPFDFPGGGIVAYHAEVLLVAIQDDGVDFRTVRVPGHAGDVGMGRIGKGFKVQVLAGSHVKDAHLHFVHGAACFRVTDIVDLRRVLQVVEDGVELHHALVHPVIG